MSDRHDGPRVSRGTLLKGSAAAAIGAMAVPDLALAARTATPKRGGTLRAGFVGGGTAETLNPFLGVTPIDEARIQNLYDPLVLVNADLTRSPGLALEWTHNKDATVWEVKLRPGVTFHNGKTFGAEDVIWSIQQMAGKTSAALPFVSGIKLGELKAVNKLTVRIPLKAADADLAGNFTYYNTWIVPKGQTAKDYKKPIGTGPFMAQSFTPGPAERVREEPELLGEGQAVRRLAQDSRTSTTTRRASTRCSRARSTSWRSCRRSRPRRTRRPATSTCWWPRRRRR